MVVTWVLALCLAQAPTNELAEALWPDTVVEDNNLSQTISQVRKALGDTEEAGPRFIATVPRRGYQFVAEVRLREARAAPVVASGRWRVIAAGAAGVLAVTVAIFWFLRASAAFFCSWYLNLPKSRILQTGGSASGDTSTRSSPAWVARS